MISGSFATTGSTQTRNSLSYINELVTGATVQGRYRITVSNNYMDDNMANVLRNTYGYQVQPKTSLMGTFDDYVISWALPAPTATPTPTAYPTATPTHTPNPTPPPTETNYPTPNPSPTPSHTPTPSPTASSTPAPTASSTPAPTASSTPAPTPTISGTPAPSPTSTSAAPTPTPTATSLYQSYNYSINATDLAAATGNTGGLVGYNNKVVVVITNGYNCGNTTERNFTYSFNAAGSSYISWLISRKTNVPVIGYYQNNTLITTGLLSTQTINPSVPC
jgi:hypothetical protein